MKQLFAYNWQVRAEWLDWWRGHATCHRTRDTSYRTTVDMGS